MKRSGKVKGYQLSDGRIISREEGVALAKDGEIYPKSANIVHHSNIYLPHWKKASLFHLQKALNVLI